MNDYRLANWSAPTDFRVGEAMKHLISQGHDLHVLRKPSRDIKKERMKEERELIATLLNAGFRLLSCLPAYDYQSGSRKDELAKIGAFVQVLVRDFETYEPLSAQTD